MMKHKEIERLIQKRLDGELKPEDSARLEDHLAKCPDCALFYEEISQTTGLIHQLEELHPQRDFNSRILARLGFGRRFAWTKAGIAFAGTWIAALLFFAYSSLPAQIIGWLTTSFPAMTRTVDRVELLFDSLSHVVMPFFRTSLSSIHPVTGLVFSILFIYLLGKALQKEAKCRA